MRTEDTFLNNRLEKALSKITKQYDLDNSIPIYLDVCDCPTNGGQMFYDANANAKQYFGKGFCNSGLMCFRIQKDKHKIRVNTISNYETTTISDYETTEIPKHLGKSLEPTNLFQWIRI